jgi:hypothetical protein
MIDFELEIFLKHHNIPKRFVFNATWFRPKEYNIIMKQLWMIWAIWVSSCWKCNRAFKDRHWHCLFCHPSSLWFRKRKEEEWFVYLAGSEKWKILKVWFTKDINDRFEHLNTNKYWWFNDWELLFKWRYQRAWEVENYLHQLLSEYSVDSQYKYCWNDAICYETFKVDYLTVRKIIDKMNAETYEVEEDYFLPLASERY